jgi:twitching motility protein PilJ
MGFATKFSEVFANRDKDDGATVLASPDTEFGPGVHAQQPAAAPGQAAPDGAGPLRLGSVMRSRPDTAPAGQQGDELALPLIGHLSLPRQLRILLMAFVFGMLLTLLALWQNSARNAIASTQTQIASDALMHSQRLGKAAPNALHGDQDAFGQLQDSRAELARDLKLLALGGDFNGRAIPAPSGARERKLAEVRTRWAGSENAAATIGAMKPQLTAFGKNLARLEELAPQMLALGDELLAAKVQRGGNARELAAIGRLMMLTQRLLHGAGEYRGTAVIRPATTSQMRRDNADAGAIVDALLNGSAALGIGPLREPALRDKATQLGARFAVYQSVIGGFLANLDKFSAAKAAEQRIIYESEAVRQMLVELQRGYRSDQDSTVGWFWLLVVASIFTLATAGSISRVMLQDSRNRTRGADARREEAEALRLMAQAKEEEAKAANDQNQAAILRLMNELQEVADGDLTVHATVSEDITGAIADSVNYTVEELRALVQRVTTTAEQVTEASDEAQQISSGLLTATEQQSREIEETSATVLKMAVEINDVSKSAGESADVARQSVAAAEQGATAVQNAIKGMIDIREQIQETSKRIKRLGESSQEIGEITELISDITEQTNVLALNAAIQAASAGEAGRGFSVVAEEVQRLAERSGEAAKQIGALVRTIQHDTHDAVAAMEKSTQGVVEGARLSDAAGAALADISRVSNRLAELIQGMAFATEMQATSANGVAHNIQHILSVTEHTQQGTQQTAQSIRQLALLAQELKNSVSRFRVAA